MASSDLDAAVGSASNYWMKCPTASGPPRSAVTDKLSELFSWGWLNGPLVQALAEAVRQDGLSQPDLVASAEIGDSGEYPGNCRRDLLRKLLH